MLTPFVTPCSRVGAAPGPDAVVDQDDLLAALGDVAGQVEELAALEDLRAEDVQVVGARGVMRDRRAVEEALRRADVARVREALRGTPHRGAVGAALDRDQASLADVVAVDVLPTGDVVLFTR